MKTKIQRIKKGKTARLISKAMIKSATTYSYIDTNSALKMVKDVCGIKVTRKTLLTWLVKYKMGRKVGGRWVVYLPLFKKFISGEAEKCPAK